MKMKLFLSAALLAGVISANAVTAPVAASASTNASPEATMKALFGDPIIVKAKGFDIKQSELDQVLTGAKANAAAQGQQLPPEFSIAILNQLITIQSLLQKATPADRTAGAAEADLQYMGLVKRFGSVEAFDRQLKAVGMTTDELRAKATQEAVAKAALKRELNINVTDNEAKAFYAKHTADFEQAETAHVRHILLMTVDPATRSPLPAAAVAAKRKQIDALLKQIRAGADFATLASQYSEDPGSKDKGGELPPFSHGEMVPQFEAAAFSMKTNTISDVVTTDYGYHIIKLLDITPAQTVPLATVSDKIKDFLMQQQTQKLAPAYLDNLKKGADVEILDPDLKAASVAAAAAAMADVTNAPAATP